MEKNVLFLYCDVENQQDVIDLSDETKADIDTCMHFCPLLMENMYFYLKNSFH